METQLNEGQGSGTESIDALLAEIESAEPTINAEAPALPETVAQADDAGPQEIIEGDEAPVGEGVVEAASADAPETPVAEPSEADKEAAKAAAKAEREAKKAQKQADAAIAKAKREEERAAKKAEREAAKAAERATKGEKPAERRQHFATRADRIQYRLGDKLGDFMVFENADALLEGDALKAKQDENFAVIRSMNKKVQNRASLLLDYCAGKSAELNSVMTIAFKLLKRDGTITSGDKGNYTTALVSGGPKNDVNPRPYGMSSARAMGNNTISLLKQLRVITADEKKQTFIPNPDSLILSLVNSKLGL